MPRHGVWRKAVCAAVAAEQDSNRRAPQPVAPDRWPRLGASRCRNAMQRTARGEDVFAAQSIVTRRRNDVEQACRHPRILNVDRERATPTGFADGDGDGDAAPFRR